MKANHSSLMILVIALLFIAGAVMNIKNPPTKPKATDCTRVLDSSGDVIPNGCDQ